MLLMDQDQSEEAFNLSEMARARTFLDRLGNVRTDLLKTASPQLINDSRELETKLNSLEQRWERLDSENDGTLNAKYAVAQRQYEDLLMRMKVANASIASSSVKTLKLPEIQKLLDTDTTLLSYFVLPEETFAFVITQHSFQAIKIPINEAYLNRKITWLRRFASTRELPSEDLRLLYCWLICPVKSYLKTRTVCIVPHRELDYLPFAALSDGRTYLNDQHTLFYLPSASALTFVHNRKKPAAGPALVLAQSRAVRLQVLDSVDEEADVVAGLYHTSALKGAKAVKSTFLERAPRSSLIHIAAHANLVATSPFFFRIMLAKDQDGTAALQLRDIYNLDLSNASLVVLSACQTNLGGEHRLGDDFEALNRAFLTAGARTVIASMWAVNDEATRDLMKLFYTNLKRGMSRAEALRIAQSETRLKHSHPYYWAGFVLTGDPGKID